MSTSSAELNTAFSDSLAFRRSRSRVMDRIEIAVVFPWAVAGAFLGTLVRGVGNAFSHACLQAASQVDCARDGLRKGAISCAASNSHRSNRISRGTDSLEEV